MFGGELGTFDMIIGGLVGALFVFFLSRQIKARNESGEAKQGSQQDWLVFAGIMGGLVLFILLLISLV